MPWNLSSERPIFSQIMERIQLDIIAGRYQPGQKLPSVRDLAAEAAVNPKTMQKAFSELERMGLVYSQRTSGRFITEDTALIQNLKAELAHMQIRDFLNKMKDFGFQLPEIMELIQALIEEEESHERSDAM